VADKGEDLEKRLKSADYLNRTGPYANRLYVYVQEEYGYASYLWVYPGTPKELVDDWCNQRTPWAKADFSDGCIPPPGPYLFRGEFDLADFRSIEEDRKSPWPRRMVLYLSGTSEVVEGFAHISDFDGSAHVHEEDDSGLRVGRYEVKGLLEPRVSYDVLGALSDIEG